MPFLPIRSPSLGLVKRRSARKLSLRESPDLQNVIFDAAICRKRMGFILDPARFQGVESGQILGIFDWHRNDHTQKLVIKKGSQLIGIGQSSEDIYGSVGSSGTRPDFCSFNDALYVADGNNPPMRTRGVAGDIASAFIATPTAKPTVSNVTGESALSAGTYDYKYTYYSTTDLVESSASLVSDKQDEDGTGADLTRIRTVKDTRVDTIRVYRRNESVGETVWRFGQELSFTNKTSLISSNSETFALADGDTLLFSVDGAANQTATFNTADFSDIANATAAEVSAVINTDITGITASAGAGNFIKIVVDAVGETLQITDGTGTPNVQFAFITTLVDYIDNSVEDTSGLFQFRKTDETVFASTRTIEANPITLTDPRYCRFLFGRMFWAGMSANPSTLFVSELERPGVLATSIDIGSHGDGDPITGLGVHFGRLLVFKSNTVYVISGVGGGLSALSVDRLETASGCIAHKTIVNHDGFLYWWGRDAIYRFDGNAAIRLSDEIESLVRDSDDQSSTTNPGNHAFGWVDSIQGCLVWQSDYLDSDGVTKSDRQLAYHFRESEHVGRPVWSMWRFSTPVGVAKMNAAAEVVLESWFERKGQPAVIISSNESILDQKDHSDERLLAPGDPAPVDAYWKSPEIDFGQPSHEKYIGDIIADVEQVSECVGITIEVDTTARFYGYRLEGVVIGTNTDSTGRLYTTVVDPGGGNATIDIYKDAARTLKVLTATFTIQSSPGGVVQVIQLLQQNGSGLTGSVRTTNFQFTFENDQTLLLSTDTATEIIYQIENGAEVTLKTFSAWANDLGRGKIRGRGRHASFKVRDQSCNAFGLVGIGIDFELLSGRGRS